MKHSYQEYKEYVDKIDWETLLVDFLDVGFCDYTVENISFDLRNRLKNFTTEEYEEEDYLQINLLDTFDDYENYYKIRDVKVIELKSGNLMLGLEVYWYRKNCSELNSQCCFRGYWDGKFWHEHNMD